MSSSATKNENDDDDQWEDLHDPSKKKKESRSIFDAFGSKKDGDGANFFAKFFGDKEKQEKEEDEEDEDEPTEKEEEEEAPPKNKKDLKNSSSSSFFDMLPNFGAKKEQDEDDSGDSGALSSILMGARQVAHGGDDKDNSMKTTDSTDTVESLISEFKLVKSVMKKNFGHLKLDALHPLSVMYYLEFEDSVKTPSWKRRKHRFMPDIDKDTVYNIHDSLYLCELSYLDSKEEVEEGLKNFKGKATYELVYCSVEGMPREPANFIAIQKDSVATKKQGKGGFLGLGGGKKALELLLVVRGTKELGDVLSDCMLEASEYRDGVSHEGVTDAGKFVVEKHSELLQYLLKESGMDTLNITVVGHSLGAGAGAIAAIEWNDQPNFNVKFIGFGCPALLDKEQSEKTKDFITTIISDSDCVPRMSGATAANMFQNAMATDWLETSFLDLEQILHVADCKLPIKIPDSKKQEIRDWAKSEYEKKIKPVIDEVPKERAEVVLFPPGRCIHVYRDGVGVSACEVPCDFFDELDVTRTMLEDHLTVPGYDKMLTELMRAHNGDSTFAFKNDVAGLREERDVRMEKQE